VIGGMYGGKKLQR